MGKLIRNGIEYGGGNGTDIFKVTQSEYDTLKQAGALVHNALYVISDAENLNCTADDIEYSTGVSVKDEIDAKADISSLSSVATSGSYNDLSNKPLSHIAAGSGRNYTSNTSLTYTNLSRTCPNGHTYIVRVRFAWVNSKPLEMAVSAKSSSWNSTQDFFAYSNLNAYMTYLLASGTTAYYLARCESSGATNVLYEEIIDVVN